MPSTPRLMRQGPNPSWPATCFRVCLRTLAKLSGEQSAADGSSSHRMTAERGNPTSSTRTVIDAISYVCTRKSWSTAKRATSAPSFVTRFARIGVKGQYRSSTRGPQRRDSATVSWPDQIRRSSDPIGPTLEIPGSMTWYTWLIAAALVAAIAAITGIKPKGTRHVAHTSLMGVARGLLFIFLAVFVLMALRAHFAG